MVVQPHIPSIKFPSTSATNGSSSPKRFGSMTSPGFRGEYEPVSAGHLDQAAYPYNGSSSTNNNSHPARYSNQPTYDIPVGGYT